MALVVALTLTFQTALAQSTSDDLATSAIVAEQSQTVRRLLAIYEALEDRRERLRELLEQLQTADSAERPGIEQQIDSHRETILQLRASFEKTAAGGTIIPESSTAQEQPLVWHEELAQIARPILNSLKEATEKPRRIAELRAAIELYQQQLDATRRASESLSQLRQREVPVPVSRGLDEISTNWEQRTRDLESSLGIARDELASLEVSEGEIFESIGNVARDFFLGSGLTLLLALVTAFVLWFALRSLGRFFGLGRAAPAGTDRAARLRLLSYAYQLLTVALVVLAVLSVFYVRGDLLLLSLAIISLAMLALGAWRFLPGYLQEARLLLNVGAARENERVFFQGLPYRISSLNLYSELRNPELEGRIRMPLAALASLISRPLTDEAWFPTSAGDYVLLPDGGFGQVLRQSIELVELKVMGSIVQYGSADFLAMNPRNLSREGFGLAVGFGIDYRHQDEALERVPERFRSGLQSAFADAGLGEDLKDLLVEFKSAGASSLDYLIYATMDGRSASSYYRIGRLIQQACVDICNREGWVIPFNQITVHRAENA